MIYFVILCLLARWRPHSINISKLCIFIARPNCMWLKVPGWQGKYILAQESFYLLGIFNDINEQDTSFLDCKYNLANLESCAVCYPENFKVSQVEWIS